MILKFRLTSRFAINTINTFVIIWIKIKYFNCNFYQWCNAGFCNIWSTSKYFEILSFCSLCHDWFFFNDFMHCLIDEILQWILTWQQYWYMKICDKYHVIQKLLICNVTIICSIFFFLMFRMFIIVLIISQKFYFFYFFIYSLLV